MTIAGIGFILNIGYKHIFNLTLDNITGETIVMHRADMCKCLDV